MDRGHVLSRFLLTVSLSGDRREILLLITLLLLIELLLFPALALLLSPQEPVVVGRSISWGRRRLSTYRPDPLLGASKLLHHIRDVM